MKPKRKSARVRVPQPAPRALYWVRCHICGGEDPAVRREGTVEPPLGWGSACPSCCGPRAEIYVCGAPSCRRQAVQERFARHSSADFVQVRLFGDDAPDASMAFPRSAIG